MDYEIIKHTHTYIYNVHKDNLYACIYMYMYEHVCIMYVRI